MNVSIEHFDLRVNWSEAADLSRSLIEGINYSIDTHWARFPEAFERSEAPRLRMLETLIRVTYGSFSDEMAKFKARIDSKAKELTPV